MPTTTPLPGPGTPAGSRGFLLVVLAALCWGTAGVTGRLVGERTDLGPLDIAWYRMAVGALALAAVHLLGRRRGRPGVRPTRPVVVRLVLVGAGLGAYQLAYFSAVALAGVSLSTLVALGLAPLLVAAAGAVLGTGRPERTTLLALGTALAGLVLLVGVSAGAGTAVLLGTLLAVGSAAGYALVTVAGGGIPAGVPVTPVAFGTGAALLTPLALAGGLRVPHDPASVALLLYLGLVPSALAYVLFFTGIRTVPGPVASTVTLLEPLTATALATGLLGERLSPAALAGGLLVLGAVVLLYLRQLRGSGAGDRARTPRGRAAGDPGPRATRGSPGRRGGAG